MSAKLPSAPIAAAGAGSQSRRRVENLTELAAALLDRAVATFDLQYGFSTASCQIYDTAWVAMITKSVNGNQEWLFPESFHYIMSNQAPDGSWGTKHASQAAGVMDTASALLALLRHSAEPLQISEYGVNELRDRIKLAVRSLEAQLSVWSDVSETNHIAVELVVPALLRHLRAEHVKLDFDFPCKSELQEMSAAKLAKFQAKALYCPGHSPATYALEAFAGDIDYDQVRQQLLDNGSMFTSPAATAAYLMNVSEWDARAESYLRHVISHGQGHGTGAVPGTFPTHIFEMNWVVATLLHAGYKLSDFSTTTLDRIAEIVRGEFVRTEGLVGHAPQTIDADDTAKALLSLKLMGRQGTASPEMLLNVFERKDGFSTFGSERDRSLSTNCHVLLTLLAWKDFSKHAAAIQKAMLFIINYWWNSVGRCKDKWHLSPFYARMLTLMASSDFLSAVDGGPDSQLDIDDNEKSRLAIILFQIGNRTLIEQCPDGSWGSSREETAYAILTLTTARELCLFTVLIDRINGAIKRGVDYLIGSSHATATKGLWTSKTMYTVKFVAEGYVLAALRTASKAEHGGNIGRQSGLQDDRSKLTKFRPLVAKTPHFRDMLDDHLSAALMEAALWLPLLRAKRLEVFPRDNPNIGKDAYLDLLPFLWTGCVYRSDTYVSNRFVDDMLFMTLINIQVDEFIEGVVTPAFGSRGIEFHALIDRVLSKACTNSRVDSPVDTPGGPWDSSTKIEPVEISEPLLRFVTFFVKGNGSNGDISPHANDYRRLTLELARFLHAQAQQMVDNTKFGKQENRDVFSTPSPYFEWVRTTAADHVSTPLSWAWVCCWLSSNLGHGAETFDTPAEKYLAAATARHLATTNRMFNDLGSVTRDTREGNLNSIHFPEFHDSGLSDGERRKALQTLAEYEHSCVESSRRRLEEELQRNSPYAPETSFARQKMNALGLLCDVASLWDQLYCLRDLSSGIHTNAKANVVDAGLS